MLALALAAGCGDGANNVDVVVSTLDFGQTNCGETPIPRVLTITNNTPNAFNFTTALSGGANSNYTIIPPTGSVLPRQQVNVMVHAKPIPQESAITENLYGETVTVTTSNSDRETVHEVAITHSARGAIFEVSTDAVNFATPQALGTTAQQPVTITNAGNVAATLKVESSYRSFRLSEPEKLLQPGEALATNIVFAPAANVTDTQTLTLTAGDVPTCGLSTTILASGTGTVKGLAAQAVPATNRGRSSSGGATTLCVRLSNGGVACAGDNRSGMRGTSDEHLLTLQPQAGKGGKGGNGGGLPVLDIFNAVHTKDGYLDNVVDLVSGTGFYCARRQPGDFWCWGDHRGLGNTAETVQRTQDYAVQLLPAGGATAMAAGYMTRCTVKPPNNQLSCLSQRQASNNVISPNGWTPTNVTQVATSGYGGAARLADGTVVTFGRNNSGERATDTNENDLPSVVPDFTDVAQVVAGGRTHRSNRFICARKADSSVWCWGRNRHGQLGNGTSGNSQTKDIANSSVPVQVMMEVVDSEPAPITATQLTAGNAHTCALVAGGTVRCWGRGSEGETGSDNTSQNVPFAEQVVGLTNATHVEAAGTRGTCATLSTGALRCWGQVRGVNYYTPQPVFAFEP